MYICTHMCICICIHVFVHLFIDLSINSQRPYGLNSLKVGSNFLTDCCKFLTVLIRLLTISFFVPKFRQIGHFWAQILYFGKKLMTNKTFLDRLRVREQLHHFSVTMHCSVKYQDCHLTDVYFSQIAYFSQFA